MAVLRRTRILAGFVIACVLFFATRRRNPLTTPEWIQHPLSGFEAFVDAGYGTIKPELVENAHRLRSAEAFLPHLQAVTLLPGITVKEAKSTCVWPEGTNVNFQYGLDRDWAKKDRDDAELAIKRREWQSFIEKDMVPYSEVKLKMEGRGIVIVAGNQDTLMRLRVILLMLLKLKSTIDVEIAYWDDEMNDKIKKELTGLYPHMYFLDLADSKNIIHIKKTHIYVNYQLKTAALVNSRFAEPLLLDSDNIPVVDPASLYDTEEYQEYGTLFWPDIARTRPNNPMWAITNTQCRKDEFEQESGQLLVDKRKFFYHLQLAAWFNNEQMSYYNEFLLGDKDMFRFSWHALKTQYGRPKKWVTSVGTLNGDFYCGHTFGQHHPNGSLAFLHGGLVKTTDLEVIKWNREHGGFFRHYKRSPNDEDFTKLTDIWIKWDTAEYMATHSKDFHGGHCTDMQAVAPRSLDELLPGFEKDFDEMGGYWMLEGYKPEPGTASPKAGAAPVAGADAVGKTIGGAAAKAAAKNADISVAAVVDDALSFDTSNKRRRRSIGTDDA